MEEHIALYQTLVKELLSQYRALRTECSEVELLFDDAHKHYMAYRVGWNKHRRIHFCLVHIDICDDLVIIQANNTEDMIDEELVRRGIPQERIRLGLLPPDVLERFADAPSARPA